MYLIEVLSSKEVALDGRHTPALYARFLSSLLAQYTSRNPISESGMPNGSDEVTSQSQLTPSPLCSWPDVPHTDICRGAQQSGNESDSTALQARYAINEADIDLSLPHFVRTVTQSFPGPIAGTQVGEPPSLDKWEGWGLGGSQPQTPMPWPSTTQLEFPHWWRG